VAEEEDLATTAAEEVDSEMTILVEAEMRLPHLLHENMVIRTETMALISLVMEPGVEVVRPGRILLFEKTPTRVISPGIDCLLATTIDLMIHRLANSVQQEEDDLERTTRTGRIDLGATDRGRTAAATRHGNKTRVEMTEETVQAIDQTVIDTTGIETSGIGTTGVETAGMDGVTEKIETEKQPLCTVIEESLAHHLLFHQHLLVRPLQVLFPRLRLLDQASVDLFPTRSLLHHSLTADPPPRLSGNARRQVPAPRHSQTPTFTTPTTPTTLGTQKRKLENASARSRRLKNWTPAGRDRWVIFLWTAKV
jgi:hypothetical protein